MNYRELKKMKLNELTPAQQADAKQQLIKAGYKDEDVWKELTFLIKPDGTIYGWSDKNFFTRK